MESAPARRKLHRKQDFANAARQKMKGIQTNEKERLREKGRGKREEGRGKREEGKGKREKGKGKREKGNREGKR